MTAATRTRKTRKTTTGSSNAETYDAITAKVIEMLEKGVAPWRKPWDANHGIPRSMSTGKPYRGINPFLLQIEALVHGYGSPWWGTYKQIAGRGGQVRKGESGTTVVFWKPIFVDDKDNPGKKKQIFFLKTFNVFNADQADGELGLPEPTKGHDHDPIADCDQAVANYLDHDGPKLVSGGSRACYSPGSDTVYLPPREAFASIAEFYAAEFHELTHSTGHQDRLARKNLLEHHSFGDADYSKEELVAELGSAFLAGATGIATETLPNSASYLQSWITVLKGDPKLLVSAAAQAQKAADLILGVNYAEAANDDEAKQGCLTTHEPASPPVRRRLPRSKPEGNDHEDDHHQHDLA